MSNFNYRKATQALNYLAIKSGGHIDTLMAMKLIWLADRLHLRKFGRTITQDEYYAMKLGPVASGTYNLIKKSGEYLAPEAIEYVSNYIAVTDTKRKKYLSCNTLDEKVFSKSDISVLNEVVDKFSNMTKWQLSDYSHLFDEWLRYKDALKEHPEDRFRINLLDFFNETPFGDSVFNQSKETLDCVKEIYTDDNPE